jgi:hypothetical protein
MMRGLSFELPVVLYALLPAVVVLLAARARQLHRRGVAARRVTVLVLLRAVGLVPVVLLLARPHATPTQEPGTRPTVAVLLDRSRSMDLRESGSTRFSRARTLTQGLTPALEARGYTVRLLGFAEGAAPLGDAGSVRPDGRATDLGGAISQALALAEHAPAAVVALTDGAANRKDANASAVQGLLEAGAPFVGVGFGRDEGVPTLGVRRLQAPFRVPPRQRFVLSAHLQATGAPLPAFDLLLLRDGRLVQSRRVAAEGSGRARLWAERFDALEAEEGLHQYSVQMRPVAPEVVVVGAVASAPVRVGEEKEFRVLFAQGALTWDFKFIGRALRSDPAVKLTGLSRTSQHSVFRQNVESAEELSGGFPTDLEGLSRYRVVVLSELRPKDLTPAQQELVARFCGELGGGLLVLGGESTFDGSWQGSRLEQLLPVTFDTAGGVRGLDRPFHLQLTREALQHAVFQVKDDGSSSRVWEGLPTFTRYGRVLQEKPGAVVWARHDQDAGPHGRRVLMAVQPYGAGLAAMVGVQNLWRWRLARDADTQTFDRFWRQLFRHLGQSGRQEFQVQIHGDEVVPHSEVRALVERQPRPDAADSEVAVTVRVRTPQGKVSFEQSLRVAQARPAEVRFRVDDEGVYTISVEDDRGVPRTTQPLEVRDVDREMEHTGRDLENLRQWAGLSRGTAMREEDVADGAALARQIQATVEEAARRVRHVPVGVTAPVLSLILAALCAEWALRRKWGLA